MKGKTCLVTGANSGIGKYTAIGLAELGATVVMVCRDSERGRTAREEIASETGNESIDLLIADLSVERFDPAASGHRLVEIRSTGRAGEQRRRVCGTRTLTGEGLEQTFALNHLGYFLSH